MTQIKPLNPGLAIIIGINKYTNGIPPLKNAVNDAQKVAKLLQTKYDYQVLKLLDEAATLSRIKELLTAIKQQQIPLNNQTVKIEENHRIFFYFAGHGIAFDGLEDASGPQGFIVPQDGKLNEEKKEKILLPMTDLHDAFIALPSRHLLVVLDCCFAGSFRWAGLNRDIVPEEKLYRERYERFTNNKAQQVITSAAYDEKALDSIYRLGQRGEVDGHSPFAEVLLKGLEGEADVNPDGAITATELYLYLQSELGKQNVKQTPGICQLKNHEKGEYIFPVPGFNPNNLDNAPPLSDDNNPYRGLASFDEINQGLFFGRQQVIKDLYRAFNDKEKPKNLTAVLGASGTGKSSLVKAGLLPRLREDGWYIVNPFRPGKSPFSALAAAMLLTVLTREVSLVKTRFFESLNATNYGSVLAWQGFLDIGEIFQIILAEYNDQKIVDSLSEFLREKPKLLTKVAGIGHSKVPEKLLLVIDQFEELVTDCSEIEKEKFLGWLEEILRDNSGKVRVIITLRSDFKAQFTSELFDEKVLQFTVPMMTQDEYREIIEKPATEKVLYFEPRELVEELINEVVQMPGALPLLSFTLSQLYFRCCDRWLMGEKSRAMTREDYQKLGGVMGALKRTATDVFKKLIKEKKGTEQTIRDVMLRMVAVSGDELARRRVPMWELVYPEPKNGEVEEVLNAFTTARLLVEGATSDGEEYVEPAHDALVTGWDKILKWKNQQQESLLLQRRLTPAAMEWKIKRQQKPKSFLDKTEPFFEVLNRKLDRIYNWLHGVKAKLTKLWRKTSEKNQLQEPKASKFLWNQDPRLQLLQQILNSSDNWLDSTETEFIQRSVWKKRKNSFVLRVAVYAFVIALSGLSLTIWIQLQQTALREKSERVANLLSTNPVEGLLLAIQATGQSRSVLGSVPQSVQFTLLRATKIAKEESRIAHDSGVMAVAISADGQTIVSGSADGNVRLWNPEGKLLAEPLKGHRGTVWTVAISADGQTIVSGSSDGSIRLWDRDGKPIGKPIQVSQTSRDTYYGGVYSVAISADGQTIVSGDYGGKVQLWNRNGKLQWSNQGHESIVYSVAITPDGQQIISGSGDGTIQRWNRKGEALWTQPLQAGDYGISAVAISPDGGTIVSAGLFDSIIKVWNSDYTEQTVGSLVGHQGSIYSLAISADGSKLVSSSTDGTIRLWELGNTGSPIKVLRERQRRGLLYSAAISGDGQTAVSSGLDNTMRLWDLSTEANQLLLNEQQQKIAISADSKSAIGVSSSGNIQLWINGQPQWQSEIKHEKVTSLAISADGKSIVIGTEAGQLQLWNQNGQPEWEWEEQLPGHEEEIVALAVSANGEGIVSADKSGTVRLWNKQGKLQWEQKSLWQDGYDVNLVISNDSQTIVASSDESQYIWNKQGNLLGKVSSSTSSLAISSDGKIVASGDGQGRVELRDTQGKLLTGFQTQSEGISSIAINTDSSIIVTADSYNSIQLWTTEGQPLETLEKSGYFDLVAIDDRGETIMAASANPGADRVLMWKIDWQSLLAVACNRLLFHPSFRNPQSNLERDAADTCRKEVWTPQQFALLLVEQGRELARSGNDQEAIAKFEQALKLDDNLKLDPTNEVDKMLALFEIERGKKLVKETKVEEALNAYKKAQELEQKLEISAESWQVLCWYGSLQEKAIEVMDACDRAVLLAPEDGSIRDIRGIARAIAGDLEGAIEDFQAYIRWSEVQTYLRLGPAEDKQSLRQEWIERLASGVNPFTPEERDRLLSDESPRESYSHLKFPIGR